MYNDALLAGSGGSLMISWLCYSGSLVSDGSAVGETDTVALSDVDRETRVNVLKTQF